MQHRIEYISIKTHYITCVKSIVATTAQRWDIKSETPCINTYNTVRNA